ncbi:MAG: type I secretion system permease/ATPase [Deltaproteobacteria bacterium]|jgi:ATP-binding cassette subfamily C protein LapB|nr:type I secretion system permease/ATPase [Deltaproteobacteria bacterium]
MPNQTTTSKVIPNETLSGLEGPSDPTAQGASQDRTFRVPGGVDFEPPILRCLSLISGLLGHPVSTVALKAGIPQGKERPPLSVCLRAAEQSGLKVGTFYRPKIETISVLTLPCILLLKNDQACILTAIHGAKAEVIYPEMGDNPKTIAVKRLEEFYSGYVLLVHPEGRLDRRASELKLVDTKEWFWGTIFKFLPIYKHVLLATVVVNVLALASPLFVMNVYDRVVPNNAFDTLWALAIGVVIEYLFDFLLRNLRSYFADIAGKNADVIIASRLMQQMAAMRLDHKPDSAGTLANNFREFETLREFFSSTTLMALVDMPFIFIFITLIGYIGGPLAFAPLIAVPVVILVGVFLQQPFQRIVEQSFREGAQKNALLVEAINGIETIKTCMAEGQIQKRWEEVVGLNARSTTRARSLANFSITFSQWSAQLVSVMIIIGGVYLISEGDLTLGGLIACNILVGRAMAPLGAVAAMLTRFQQSRIALKALDLLMSQPNERPMGQEFIRGQGLEPTLTFDKVQFRYPDSQTLALDNLSLHIRAGEKVGIIGRTGSGKSTLGRLCLGLYQQQEGSVKLGGIDLRQLHVADLRSHIGYVSQDNYLFYGSIRENIALGAPYVDGQSILRAANIAGVTDFVRNHPSGFDWQVGERGMNLSGGQRQAVTIARALLLDPQILILDEPSSAMDNNAEALLRQRLMSILDEKTLVLFTHRNSMLQLIDRLVVMDSGKIVADGPKADVIKALNEGQVKVAIPHQAR